MLYRMTMLQVYPLTFEIKKQKNKIHKSLHRFRWKWKYSKPFSVKLKFQESCHWSWSLNTWNKHIPKVVYDSNMEIYQSLKVLLLNVATQKLSHSHHMLLTCTCKGICFISIDVKRVGLSVVFGKRQHFRVNYVCLCTYLAIYFWKLYLNTSINL